jgi:hypothetical protein
MNEKERIFDLETKKYGDLYIGDNPHIGRIRSEFEEKVKVAGYDAVLGREFEREVNL